MNKKQLLFLAVATTVWSAFLLSDSASAMAGENQVIKLFNDGAKWLMAISAGIAFFFAVVGGIMYMTSRDNFEKAMGAKTTLINVAIGIGVVFGASLFVTTITEWIKSSIGS